MANSSVIDLERERRKLSNIMKWDAVATIGTLVASFYTGGLTTVGAITAFTKGITDFGKYSTEIKEHNGFFMWKLKE